MKTRNKINLIALTVLILTQPLSAHDHNEEPHYEWFEGNQVAIREDGIYTDSKKGMMKLNVVAYDSINDKYKVQCNCLQIHDRDPTEALSCPFEYPLENSSYRNDPIFDLEQNAFFEDEVEEEEN